MSARPYTSIPVAVSTRDTLDGLVAIAADRGVTLSRAELVRGLAAVYGQAYVERITAPAPPSP